MTALCDLTWPEAERLAADGAMLAVPVGSVVQHGPHLPLGTDTDIALALVNRLAGARRDVIVAPPAAYGASGAHAGFAGTISIGPQALEMMLTGLCRSAATTFRRILLISLHAGNDKSVINAVGRLRAEHIEVIAWMPAAVPAVVPAALMDPDPSLATSTAQGRLADAVPHLVGRAATGDIHAGRFETSVQLALDPKRVRLGLAEPGTAAPLPELVAVLRETGIRALSPNGVLGDPTGASADDGEQLLRSLDSQLSAVVSRWIPGLLRARGRDQRPCHSADLTALPGRRGSTRRSGRIRRESKVL